MSQNDREYITNVSNLVELACNKYRTDTDVANIRVKLEISPASFTLKIDVNNTESSSTETNAYDMRLNKIEDTLKEISSTLKSYDEQIKVDEINSTLKAHTTQMNMIRASIADLKSGAGENADYILEDYYNEEADKCGRNSYRRK